MLDPIVAQVPNEISVRVYGSHTTVHTSIKKERTVTVNLE